MLADCRLCRMDCWTRSRSSFLSPFFCIRPLSLLRTSPRQTSLDPGDRLRVQPASVRLSIVRSSQSTRAQQLLGNHPCFQLAAAPSLAGSVQRNPAWRRRSPAQPQARFQLWSCGDGLREWQESGARWPVFRRVFVRVHARVLDMVQRRVTPPVDQPDAQARVSRTLARASGWCDRRGRDRKALPKRTTH